MSQDLSHTSTLPYTAPTSQKVRAPLNLPPPIHSMAPKTTNDRDLTQDAFIQQHDHLSDCKDAIFNADEGADRRKASDDFVAALVSRTNCNLHRILY
jgi:hypothetical protein